MHYTTLGRTGLRVSIMGLGCGGHSRLGMRTGNTEAESLAVIRQALDAGINFLDTAEAYGTEELVGKAIQNVSRDSLIISTKKSSWDDEPLTEKSMRASLEASLRRLGTDYVDIYHWHGVPIEQYESLASDIVAPTLHALRDEGKIRFLGITEAFGPDPGHVTLQRALQDDYWDVMMVGFNILNQSARQRVFPETIRQNIGVLVMFAIRNALSRPERLREVIQELIDRGQLDPADIDGAAPLDFLLREGGAISVPDAAYRFGRDEPGTHVVLSGTGNADHVRANAESLARPPLPAEVVERLKHIFRNVDAVAGN